MSLLPAFGLLAASVGIVVVAAITARQPARVPALEEHLQRWSALHDGIDPTGNRVVAGWLRLMHVLGRPLARWGVHPDVITVTGLWWAAAVVVLALPGGRWPLLAALAVVLGGVADGLDGTVAALTDRASAWGGVLDAMVDRGADLLVLGALVAVGAPLAAAATAGASLFALEYLRARAGQLGARLTTVTVGERATRLVLVGVALWCAGLFPGWATTIASVATWAVAAVAVIGLLQLLPAARRALR